MPSFWGNPFHPAPIGHLYLQGLCNLVICPLGKRTALLTSLTHCPLLVYSRASGPFLLLCPSSRPETGAASSQLDSPTVKELLSLRETQLISNGPPRSCVCQNSRKQVQGAVRGADPLCDVLTRVLCALVCTGQNVNLCLSPSFPKESF